jgi:branched-chain amino acid transport system substrate-binding protein
MRCPRARSTRLAAVMAAVAAVTAACGISSADTLSSTLSAPSGRPITVGISLPLSGPQQAGGFQADGLASQRGYRLWASDVNSHGGLLGRPVRLIFLNDKGDENLTKANYVTLITKDHVDLTLAPFSSLLTVDAATVCRKYGYALAAGSAGAPSVYALGYRNVFSTNVPVAVQLFPFANWVLSLTGSARPATAAYAMVNDPFADPPVIATQSKLEKGGIKTVYSNTTIPRNNPGYTNIHTAALMADAKQVAQKKADMVVLGSVDVPTVAAFVHEFIRLNYQPKIFIATAGPDQGQAFLNAIGTGNADGIMVPNGWYGSFPDPLSHVMVQNYIAKYGGTASDINADVAEAYSAGQVLAAAVTATHAVGAAGQKKIIDYLHSGVNVPTVLGAVKFSSVGQNVNATNQALIFQWQQGGHVFVPVLPHTFTGLSPIIPTKPNWTG